MGAEGRRGDPRDLMDNLRAHRAHDVPPFDVAHVRRRAPEVGVRLPAEVRAAYLNLIEPRWKTLRSLGLAGRFFEAREQIEEAIEIARDYRNAHRHPYVWGRRGRRRAARRPGAVAMPTVRAMGG